MERWIIYRHIRKRRNRSIFQLKFILPERDARSIASLSFSHIWSPFYSCFLRFAFQSIWRCKLELYSCEAGTTGVHMRVGDGLLEPRVLHWITTLHQLTWWRHLLRENFSTIYNEWPRYFSHQRNPFSAL